LSRGDLSRRQRLEEAIEELTQRLGRVPDDTEISARLGLSLDEYGNLLDRLRGVGFMVEGLDYRPFAGTASGAGSGEAPSVVRRVDMGL